MSRATVALLCSLTLLGCVDAPASDAGPGADAGEARDARVSRPDGAVPVGGECFDSGDCEDGHLCIEHVGATPETVCMAECPLQGRRFCEGGEVCTASDADTRVCYLGGATEEGSPCTSNFECVRGTICVLDEVAQTCARACDSSTAENCRLGERCERLEGMGGKGFCTPE